MSRIDTSSDDETSPKPVRRPGPIAVLLLTLAVVVTVAALVLAGRSGPVAHPASRNQSVVTPEARQVTCPSSATDTTSYVGLLPGTRAGGSVTADLRPLAVQAGTVAEIGRPGRLPLALVARRQAARGIFASRVQDRGGMTRCGSPRASWWFTGAGANPAHYSTIELVNPRPGPAVADITVWGPDGEVEGAGLRGISVRAGGSRSVNLANAAPTDGNLAIHVQVSRGLVVADVADHDLDVLDPKARAAQEWIPEQVAPSRHVVLTGLSPPAAQKAPSDASSLPPALRSGGALVVLNPGSAAVVARVRISDRDGGSDPAGLQATTVPPQSALTVPLDGKVERAGSALVVDADGPVTAGYVVPGKTDLLHAVPGVHWQGPAAVALPPDGERTLVLTADHGGGRVVVTQRTGDGQRISARRVDVPARTTLPVDLQRGAASVVVTSRGQVVGSVLVARGQTYSALALSPVFAALRTPQVRPEG